MDGANLSAEDGGGKPEMKVPFLKTDFDITGDGREAAWQGVPWSALHRRDGSVHDYQCRVKALYSNTGLYVLMDSTDNKLSATMQEDFLNLWTEDVFEVFLWPHEGWPVYFEYEISPLAKELPIIVPNFDGQFYGWRPWHYDSARATKKAVKIVGGEAKSGAHIKGWMAEIYFPFDLLKPLQNVPPKPGSRWRANFYRMDYDDGKTSSWDWARVGKSFHEFQKFGTLVFE